MLVLHENNPHPANNQWVARFTTMTIGSCLCSHETAAFFTQKKHIFPDAIFFLNDVLELCLQIHYNVLLLDKQTMYVFGTTSESSVIKVKLTSTYSTNRNLSPYKVRMNASIDYSRPSHNFEAIRCFTIKTEASIYYCVVILCSSHHLKQKHNDKNNCYANNNAVDEIKKYLS